MRRIASVIVRLSAWLAPRRLRAQWREEWLAEIQASSTSGMRVLTRTVAAPLDAALLRWTSRTVDLPLRHGWSADVRDAMRALLKTPMQAITMIGCLGVGAALMVTMFAITHALFGSGRLPGVDDRDRVARVLGSSGPGRTHTLTMRQFRAVDWNALPPAIEKAGGELGWKFLLRVGGTNQESKGAFVTGNFFGVFGSVPAAGRLIGPFDDRPDAEPVVVISHGFWKRHFNGDTGVIGSSLHIGTTTCLIVGVAPKGFIGTRVAGLGQRPDERFDVWLPMSLTATWTGFPRLTDISGQPRTGVAPGPNVSVRMGSDGVGDMVGPALVARLAPAVTREAADQQLQALVPQLAEPFPNGATKRVTLQPFMVMPLDSGDFVPAYTMLFLVPFLVLLIGCANVAGLQSARAAWRRHELAVRTSLGASRGRLARLLMVEVFVIASAAALLAWALSTWALRFTGAVFPFHAEADWRVFAFALGLPVLITLLIGLAPSWRAAGIDVLSGLKSGSRDGQQGQWKFRRIAVVTQIALSVVLVFAAVMLTRAVSGGLAPGQTAAPDVTVAGFYFNDVGLTPDAQRAAVQALIQQARDLAGPGDVAISLQGWPRGGMAGVGERRSGFHPEDWIGARVATPAIFNLLNLRVIAGRAYGHGEHDVMLVNEAFARRYSSPDRILSEAFDVTTDAAPPVRRRVIGIVADERSPLPALSTGPFVYVPLDTAGLRAMTIFARTSNPTGLRQRLQDAATAIYPTLAPRPLATIAELQRQQYRSVRWMAQALSVIGSMALLLAAIGLFAMVSASVSQRTREFGVRLALGADTGGIIALVLREVGRVAAIGIAAGIVLSVPVAMLLRSAFLRNATLADPQGFVLGIAVMLATIVIAAYLPARRAASVNPLAALRAD